MDTKVKARGLGFSGIRLNSQKLSEDFSELQHRERIALMMTLGHAAKQLRFEYLFKKGRLIYHL